MLVGLGHVDLVCRDLERSLAFYAAVFGPLGLEPPFLVEGERGEQIHYLRLPSVGSGSIGLRQAQEDQEFELDAPGLHHLALAVESREDVDAAHAAAVAAGSPILHGPKAWPLYHPGYYATFFLDPSARPRSRRMPHARREPARIPRSSPDARRSSPARRVLRHPGAGRAESVAAQSSVSPSFGTMTPSSAR